VAKPKATVEAIEALSLNAPPSPPLLRALDRKAPMMIRYSLLVLPLVAALFALAHAANAQVNITNEANEAVLDNGAVQVRIAADGAIVANRRDQPAHRLSSRPSVFIRGQDQNLLAGLVPSIRTMQTRDSLGIGAVAELTYATAAGPVRVDLVLYEGGELFTVEVRIMPTRAVEVTGFVPLEGTVSLGAGEVRAVMHDRMWEATVRTVSQRRDSQFFTILYNRSTRLGAVLGAMTGEAESTVRTAAQSAGTALRLSTSYGGPGAGVLRVPAGGTGRSGAFAVMLPGDIFAGMEAYGAAVRSYNGIRLYNPIPAGWCSWDAYGATVSAKNILDTIQVIKDLRLTEYGFNVLQIDDGWQCGFRRSGDWRPIPSRFPEGIPPLTRAANEIGVTLGLWISPFSDEDAPQSAGPDGSLKPGSPGWMRNHVPVLVNHPEFSTYPDKKATVVGREMLEYDLSLPAFQQFLTDTMRQFTEEWGSRYIKADFLAWNYAVQHDRSRPHHDVFRDALKAMRAGMAPGTYFMTCISHEWKSLGIADSQRIGNDVSSGWNGIRPTIRCAAPLYFMNGNFWWNDPDQLHVAGGVGPDGRRRGLTLDQARAWAAMIALYGGVTLTGDRLTELAPERMKLFTQCMPATGRTARPLDLFDVLTSVSPEGHSSVWALPVSKSFGNYHVVALFNWTNQPQPRRLDLTALGYERDARPMVLDYWNNSLVSQAPVDGVLELPVAPTSCRLLVVHPPSDRPRFLSSDRHLTAGMVDVSEAAYDADRRSLDGRSARLVSDVEFQYTFHVPDGMRATKATFGGRAADIRAEGNVAVVSFKPPGAEIQWSVQFAPAP